MLAFSAFRGASALGGPPCLAALRSLLSGGAPLPPSLSAAASTSAGSGDTPPHPATAPHESTYLDFPGAKVPFTSEMAFIGGAFSPLEPLPCYRAMDGRGGDLPGAALPHTLDEATATRMYTTMVSLQAVDTIFYEAQRQVCGQRGPEDGAGWVVSPGRPRGGYPAGGGPAESVLKRQEAPLFSSSSPSASPPPRAGSPST